MQWRLLFDCFRKLRLSFAPTLSLRTNRLACELSAMRRQYKAPFRFTALPRELQLHMAEFLDLRDLENLSLSSKAVRADVVSKEIVRELRRS